MISSTKNDDIKKSYEFPKLMKSTHSGNVILFNEPSKGTVVCIGERDYSSNTIGEYSASWVMDSFVDYDGSVTLINE